MRCSISRKYCAMYSSSISIVFIYFPLYAIDIQFKLKLVSFPFLYKARWKNSLNREKMFYGMEKNMKIIMFYINFPNWAFEWVKESSRTTNSLEICKKTLIYNIIKSNFVSLLLLIECVCNHKLNLYKFSSNVTCIMF